MSIADSYGYPAASHINVIVAEHKARGGNPLPVSGDHTARARAARLQCDSLDSEGKKVARYSI